MSPTKSEALHLEDEAWMRRALELATISAQQGEVPVGAVVVRDGLMLGEGQNCPIGQCDPSAHAEISALRAAAKLEANYRLSGATLYVTIEPCTMCVGAIVHARIARVVFGAREPKAGAVVSQNQLFSHPAMNSAVVFSEGVLAESCASLMADFFQTRRAKKKALKALSKTHGAP